MKNHNTDILFILILGLLSMLTPLAIDMYLPSFGAIASDLHVSKERIQTTLALFTMGFAVGQLLWGPLSDSYGRKPTIIVGVIVAAVIALWLTQVGSYTTVTYCAFCKAFLVLLLRWLQAPCLEIFSTRRLSPR